jgi:hypothetical protein
MKSLTITQRNIYSYFLNHFQKGRQQPCFVPLFASRKEREICHIWAVQELERKGLIRLDQTASHYTKWIMHQPEG